MKNMSLRKFRDQIAELTSPVEVSLRDGDGNIRVLGYWTPYAQIPSDAKPLIPPELGPGPSELVAEGGSQLGSTLDIPVDEEPAPRVIRTPEEVAAVVSSNPVRAVPKPSQLRRRR